MVDGLHAVGPATGERGNDYYGPRTPVFSSVVPEVTATRGEACADRGGQAEMGTLTDLSAWRAPDRGLRRPQAGTVTRTAVPT
jgi:hypothetical protein